MAAWREALTSERLNYRLDRFLHLHPVVQLVLVLSATGGLALVFGVILVLLGDGDVRGLGEGLWWAVTHMLDSGSVAADRGLPRRLFGVGVTLSGLIALAVLTGAFASSFADRIRVIRQGRIPVFERGHLALLGWNPRGAVVLRELGASGLGATVVILADQDRDLLEERVHEALYGVRHRLRIVVKRGDPTTTAAVRSIGARAARVIAVLPEMDPERGGPGQPAGGQRADRAALRSLLALRRVLRGRPVPVVIEVSCRAGVEMLRLCAGAEDVVAVDAREIHAQVLAHAIQQAGAFDVVRQILSLDGRSIHVHPALDFAGQTFDAAHESIEVGVLLGLLRGGEPLLSPGGACVIEPDDRLLVLSDAGVLARGRGKLPRITGEGVRSESRSGEPGPLHVLVVRYKPELASIVEFLGAQRAARVTVIVAPEEVEGVLRAQREARFGDAEVEVLSADPLDVGAVASALAMDPGVALLLAPDVPPHAFADADSDQIITLLHLRRLSAARATPLHAVLELRSPETRRLIAHSHAVDFVLSGEIVGMLLAQELHALYESRAGGVIPGATYQRILDVISASIRIRPLAEYAAGYALPSFGHVAAVARARGEVAIGVGETGAAAVLLPDRDQRFDVNGASAIVLRAPLRGAEVGDAQRENAGAAA